MVQPVALKRPRGGWWRGGGRGTSPRLARALVCGAPFFSTCSVPSRPWVSTPLSGSRVCPGCLCAPRKARRVVLGHPPRAHLDAWGSWTDSCPRGTQQSQGCVLLMPSVQPRWGLRSVQTGLWVPNLLAPARTNLQLLEPRSSWLIAPE